MYAVNAQLVLPFAGIFIVSGLLDGMCVCVVCCVSVCLCVCLCVYLILCVWVGQCLLEGL